MKDEEIFEIITKEKKKWCIISYDKFRRHPLDKFAQDCLVVRLHSNWRKQVVPERCWRFIQIFHLKIANFTKMPLGKVYKLDKKGKLEPIK
jgi:hypothetical protein